MNMSAQDLIRRILDVDLKVEKELLGELIKVIRTLTPREEKVIKMRYGLEGEMGKTQKEIGSNFDVSRSRIRQIEDKALRKLGHASRRRRLEKHLNIRWNQVKS